MTCDSPREQKTFAESRHILPSTTAALSAVPISSRCGMALARWIARCVVMMVPFAASHAQTLSYFGGISSAWGEKSAIICTLTCVKGSISSNRNLNAPTVGVTMTVRPVGPLELETGGFLAPKGWAVTAPTLRVVYLEIPLLAHLGFWPESGFGVGVTAGAAADLDLLTPGHSDVAVVGGIRLQTATSRGKRYSLNIRFAKGFNTIYGLQNHVVTLLFGFSSARRRTP